MTETGPETLARLTHADPPPWTISSVAELCGVSRMTVYNWLSGASEPGVSVAVILERELGIPVESWSRARKGEQARKL